MTETIDTAAIRARVKELPERMRVNGIPMYRTTNDIKAWGDFTDESREIVIALCDALDDESKTSADAREARDRFEAKLDDANRKLADLRAAIHEGAMRKVWTGSTAEKLAALGAALDAQDKEKGD